MKPGERIRMIEELVDGISNWEYDKLLDCMQEQMHQLYSHMTPEELQKEYNSFKEDDDE